MERVPPERVLTRDGGPRVRLGEPIRLRLETWMRAPLKKYAAELSEAAKHTVSLAGAIRDLLHQALHGHAPSEAYLSAYAQGFIAGYSDGKSRASSKGRENVSDDDSVRAACGPIRPQPSHDNGDYRRGPDGEGGSEL